MVCHHHPQAHYHNTRHGPSWPPRRPTSPDSALSRAERRWRPQKPAGCSQRVERPPIKPKIMVLEAAFAQKLGLQHLRAQEAHASRSEGQKFGGFGWLARCFSPLGRPCINHSKGEARGTGDRRVRHAAHSRHPRSATARVVTPRGSRRQLLAGARPP